MDAMTGGEEKRKLLITNVSLDEPQLQKIALLIKHEQSQLAMRSWDCLNVIEYYKKEIENLPEGQEPDPVKIKLMRETEIVTRYLDDENDMLEVARQSIESALASFQK
jgi:hypothetical protein